jgi:hypothetical protein
MQIRWPRGARRTLGNNGMSGGRAALLSLSTMFFLLLFFVSSGLSPVLCVRVHFFFLNRKPAIPVHFFFPQSSTNLHRLFFGISLTPKTARFIFRHRLNRKRKDFTVQFRVCDFLIVVAILNETGKFVDFPI